jgi:hypothetical protein
VPSAFRRCFAALLALPLLCAPLRAGEGDEHLFADNSSGATANRGKPYNYLMEKLEEYTRGQAREGDQDYYIVAGPAAAARGP